MSFHSILFDLASSSDHAEIAVEPEFFRDLNLDQVLNSIVAGRAEYGLKPLLYTPLHDVAALIYRQEALRDLEKLDVQTAVREFALRMHAVREQVTQAQKLRYKYQSEQWFLTAVETYGDAVDSLTRTLAGLDLRSRGFRTLREYLTRYTASAAFAARGAETQMVKDLLAGVRYCVRIEGGRVRVSGYAGEADYSAEVEATFARFEQGAVKDYRLKLSDFVDMNHVEAQVLDMVAKLNPDVFTRLDAYCDRHAQYLDPVIEAFDREVQFYLGYLEFVEPLKSAGLFFCYPVTSTSSKEEFVTDGFDLALAAKLVPEHKAVVCNDFFLQGPERMLVVTGANQGGKTTFARMFGQLHYLAALGYPVPATSARLFLPDRIFAHFERDEDLTNLRGKLEDELVRMRDIIDEATSQSVLVLNESFTSTTLTDAVSLGTRVLTRVLALDLLSVCVTFVEEFASLASGTVSMVSTMVPGDPSARTYNFVRKAPDGLAYAEAIARKYGLDYASLRARVGG